MLSITEIQTAVLTHLTDYPDARFVTDTQLILDPAAGGGIMNLDTLLGLLSQAPAPYHEEVIEDFVTKLVTARATVPAAVEKLDRRQVLAGVTQLVYPEGSLPGHQKPVALTAGLVATWALVDGETLAVMPPEKFLAHATEEELTQRARARVRAYARGVRTTHELGGVFLTGGRQTSSIALFIDDCAKAIGLPRCEHGYLVAIPDRWHTIIIPATEIERLLPLVEVATGTYAHSEQPMSWFIHHWHEGRLKPVLTDRGLTAPPALEALHGPISHWNLEEDYWSGFYSA